MPQMAPMMWLFLFFYFILIFMLFISNFYFMYSPNSPLTSNKMGPYYSSLPWQW